MKHRRRNPSALAGANRFLTWAAVLFGAYEFVTYVWPLLQKLGSAGSTAVNAVTTPVANAYVALTSPAYVAPSGSVVLPNGQEITMNSIAQGSGLTPITLADGTPAATFVWNGSTYQITNALDPNGNRLATLPTG